MMRMMDGSEGSRDDELMVDGKLDPVAEALARQDASPSNGPKRYHEMSAEERRASWAAVRDANRKDARRSRRMPWSFAIMCVLSIVVGLYMLRHDQRIVGIVLLYASIAFAGFAVIAFAKVLTHGMPGTGDLPPPPGL